MFGTIYFIYIGSCPIYEQDTASLPQVNPQPMVAARKMLVEKKAATVARIKSIQPPANNDAGAVMASSN